MKTKGEIKMKRNFEIVGEGIVLNELGREVDLTNRDCRFDQIRELKQENKMLKRVIVAMSFIMLLMVGTVILSIKGAIYSEKLVDITNERNVLLHKQIEVYDSIVSDLKAEIEVLLSEKQALLTASLDRGNYKEIYYNTNKGKTINTYMKYSDTITSSGSVVRQYKIEDNLITIYSDSLDSLKDLNQKLGYEYYIGRGGYIDAMLQINGVYLINY